MPMLRNFCFLIGFLISARYVGSQDIHTAFTCQQKSEDFVKLFSDRVSALQRAKKMTVAEVLAYLKISPSMMSMIRNGTRAPSLKTVRRLEEAERAAGLAPPEQQPTALARLAGQIAERGEMSAPLAKLRGQAPDCAAIVASTPEGKAMIKRLAEFAESFQEELQGVKSEMQSMRELLEAKNNQQQKQKRRGK